MELGLGIGALSVFFTRRRIWGAHRCCSLSHQHDRGCEPVVIGRREPMFFDLIPQRYLYDLMDATIVGVFGWYGVRDTIEVFKSK